MFRGELRPRTCAPLWGRVDRVDTHQTSERDVIARINRYATLRAAERAIEPSVRDRRKLPTASIGRDLLFSLRGASKAVHDGGGDTGAVQSLIEDIDNTLTEYAQQLKTIINETPMIQLRASLPSIADQFRVEAIALLDVCLEQEEIDECPMLLVDFLITLLSSSQGHSVRSMSSDPCCASPTVERLCDEWKDKTDLQAEDLALEFRNAAIEALSLDDLEPLIQRVRDLKHPLGYRYFHPDVLRGIVGYNLAVANRFTSVMDQSREHDRTLTEALANLRARDAPKADGAAKNAEGAAHDSRAQAPGSANAVEKSSRLIGPDFSQLERALRRIAGGDGDGKVES